MRSSLPFVGFPAFSRPRSGSVGGKPLPSPRLVSIVVHADVSHLHSRYTKSPGWLAYWEICHESERIKVLNCLLIKVLIVLKNNCQTTHRLPINESSAFCWLSIFTVDGNQRIWWMQLDRCIVIMWKPRSVRLVLYCIYMAYTSYLLVFLYSFIIITII